MTDDDNAMAEIGAMGEVAKALQPLDEQARGRVLDWAFGRFSIAQRPPKTVSQYRDSPPPASEAENDSLEASSEKTFDDIAALYSVAAPGTEPEKALVGGYWFQVIEEESDFDSQSVNRELKHLGHGVGNITRAIDSLMGRKPQLVIQTRKSGKSQQARKRYRLTNEGIKAIERMVRGTE